jgi:hypothetical protein
MIPGTLIRTDADLCRLWQDMMGSGGFARRSLWMIFLDNESRVQPLVVPIDDIPAEPEPELLRGLGTTLDGVIDGENASSVALLLSRPGPSRALDQDRRWARALHSEFGPRFTRWPVHLATRDRLQVFAPDDLLVGQVPGGGLQT